MITKICKTCRKEFKTRLCEIKKGKGKYCSYKCYWDNHRITKKCLNCRKEFQVYLCLKNKRKFCSTNCSYSYHKGKSRKKLSKAHKLALSINHRNVVGCKNPSWNGGISKRPDGRILLWNPNHPFHTIHNYVRRSRLIAEKCLSRYLEPEEVIHHIDNDPSNDRPENLYLFPSKSKHTTYEHLKNKPILESNLL